MTIRARAPIALLAVLYALSVAGLFASRVREFADESDNLLGGWVLARGARLYVDYFSSHMPLPYFIAVVPTLLGAERLEEFRWFTNALLVLATLTVVWTLRRRLPPIVLGTWAVLTVFAHILQWGAMLTAGTCAAFGVLLAGLLFFSTPDLCFSRRDMLALSGAVFVAVQSELLSVFPLAVLAAAYVAVRWRTPRTIGLLAAIVAVPHVLVFGAAWATGTASEFAYDAFQFNQTYYAQYLMNPSVVGMLHDWQAQYRTFLLEALLDPLSVEACLVWGNVFAAVLVGRSRGLLVGGLYYLFVAIAHVRTSGMYYVLSYFSLALIVAWTASSVSRRPRWRQLRAVVGAVLLVTFVVDVGRDYDFASSPPRDLAEVALIQSLTGPDERIFVGPYDPYMYLAARRLPATTSPFYFPWQALDPRTEGRLIQELRTRRPPIVLFRRDELVNDRWSPREYGTRVLDVLDLDYAPRDPDSVVGSNVLVRRDRVR